MTAADRDGAVAPTVRAHVAALKLTDFRNYAALSLPFDQRSVVLTGANGAGKTNLLEAVSFLSPGRGLRRAALEDVARKDGSGSWAVAATLHNAAGMVERRASLLRCDSDHMCRRKHDSRQTGICWRTSCASRPTRSNPSSFARARRR